MSSYELLGGLQLDVEHSALERQVRDVSSDFQRVSTTIVLGGGDCEGRGEDVTWDNDDHDRFDLPDLSGRRTIDELSRAVADQPLFSGGPPTREASWNYRRWAIESAALDLALRQAGLSLGEVMDREYRPVRFVVSTRLDVGRWLEVDPDLEFKLDPVSDWDRELMEVIAATGRARVLDLKAYYQVPEVKQEADERLYADVVELFPDAIIEDAALTSSTRDILRPAENRLSWDAPIHSVADVKTLELRPRYLNIKPSRFGSLSALLDCLDYCDEEGIVPYGGGQFELGIGRTQIQALASLFYPDSPSDIAPGGYNAPEPRAGLPRSPLVPPAHPLGFGLH